MADRWWGVVASVVCMGCEGLVGIDDWTPNGVAPEDASGQVASSSSASSGPGGWAGAGGAATGSGGSAGDGGAASSSGPGSSSSASASSSATGGSGPCVSQPDGASCGPKESSRCCNETCVDISSDEAHCGGCNTACGAYACETVAATDVGCSRAPVDTSGRCGCTVNADCPLNQVCNTTAPYTNRCTPDSAANCDGVFVDVASCPNYCAY